MNELNTAKCAYCGRVYDLSNPESFRESGFAVITGRIETEYCESTYFDITCSYECTFYKLRPCMAPVVAFPKMFVRNKCDLQNGRSEKNA